ncbi:3'-5' exonuclease [[Eubacterium] cellulosolvens]
MTAVMTDIETLSSQPDGAIISIGLCLFDDKHVIDSQEILIDVKLTPGHRDPKTIDWWNQQEPEVFRHAMSGNCAPWLACDLFTDICAHWNAAQLWANPPTFDIMMLRRLFETYDRKFPFHYTAERDFRTLRKMADSLGINYQEPYQERVAHDAREDAVCQARALQIILDGLALTQCLATP